MGARGVPSSGYCGAVSLALYRTYRPGRLADVVGQEHVIEPLSRALSTGRIHHAYLFSGPRGCGKTSTARIMARSLNCEQGPTPDPCGECSSCLDLAPNGPGSLDVIELDAASHGGVDDTRELRERAMFAPASSRYKVYIIDEAHMVSTQGFNALLKLIEEPPEHVRFIFATTDVDKVLSTIRSRTFNYTFQLVPTRVLQEQLARVCEAEGVDAEPAALALVARAGAGSVRDALSMLGQVIAGSGPDGVTYVTAARQLGVTDVTLLDATVEALAERDGAALFTVIDRVIDVGHDPRRFATDLLQRLRDLIVLSAMPPEQALPLLDAPESQIASMREQVARFELAELSRSADLVSEALSDIKGATAPRLHLELMVARLLLPAADDSVRGLTVRVDHLERGLSTSARPSLPTSAPQHPPAPAATSASSTPASSPPASAPPASAPAAPSPPASRPATQAPTPPAASDRPGPPPRLSRVAPSTASESPRPPAAAAPERSEPPAAEQPAPQTPRPAAAANLSLDQVRSMWPAVLEAVKATKRVSWMVLEASIPLSLQDGVLAVGVDTVNLVNAIRNSGHDQVLRQAIIDVLHLDVSVDVVLSDARAASSAAASDAPTIDDPDAEDDELTGESLAIRELGATIIGEIEQR